MDAEAHMGYQREKHQENAVDMAHARHNRHPMVNTRTRRARRTWDVLRGLPFCKGDAQKEMLPEGAICATVVDCMYRLPCVCSTLYLTYWKHDLMLDRSLGNFLASEWRGTIKITVLNVLFSFVSPGPLGARLYLLF